MILPTIHLNGTASKDLMADNRAAAQALREAISRLSMAAPNGRDYYPQGPTAYEQARAQFVAQYEHLRAVQVYLDAIAEHLLDHNGN